MGMVKRFLEEVSEAIGAGGEITPEVHEVATILIQDKQEVSANDCNFAHSARLALGKINERNKLSGFPFNYIVDYGTNTGPSSRHFVGAKTMDEISMLISDMAMTGVPTSAKKFEDELHEGIPMKPKWVTACDMYKILKLKEPK